MNSALLVPVMVMLVIDSVAVPALLSVTVCGALLEPIVWLANVRLVGDKEADGVPAAPAPVNDTVCGLPVAPSVMVTAATSAPLAEGVNVTLIVQLPLALTLPPQVLLSAKSLAFAPVIVMLVIYRIAVPLLVSVTLFAALVVPTV